MIIWLASYPKSGNTLLRSILISLIHSEDGIVNFDKLHLISNYPAGPFFEKFTKNFSDIKELSKYWIKSQELINKNKKLKFFKTHNAMCSIDNNPFTNSKNTVGAIYMVRDPRDIIVSASRYYNTNYEQTKNNMMNKYMDLINVYNNKPISTFLGSWDDHYNSWLENCKNILLIKYENLISNKEMEIRNIVNFINRFAKLEVSEAKIKNSVASSAFENMRDMEDKGLFKEGSKDSNGNNIPFFNQGKKGGWQKVLENKLVNEIEKKFEREMKELGYLY